MNKENRKKTMIEVNEVNPEIMEQAEVKEYSEMVQSLLKHCNDNKIPIICLSAEPKSTVAILAAQGSNKDFMTLFVDLFQRVPDFMEILMDALQYLSAKQKLDSSVQYLINDVFKNNKG